MSILPLRASGYDGGTQKMHSTRLLHVSIVITYARHYGASDYFRIAGNLSGLQFHANEARDVI